VSEAIHNTTVVDVKIYLRRHVKAHWTTRRRLVRLAADVKAAMGTREREAVRGVLLTEAMRDREKRSAGFYLALVSGRQR
jgi:hypothetical protein